MNSKNNLNGTVTISVEDFERLREIESKTPCVKMIYDRVGLFDKIVYLSESEAIKLFLDAHENKTKELNDIIFSKQKEILELKEKIKELDVVIQGMINPSKDDSRPWWKKIFN